MTLPDGFGVRLSSRTKVCDGGRSLVGGSRGSVLYLSDVAAELLDGGPVLRAHTSDAATLARSLLDRGFAEPWWPDPAGPDSQVLDVTVVVPVRDRAQDLTL